MSGVTAKIGIIGCGRVSGHHCRSILKARGTELVAVCDLDFGKAKAYQDEYGARASGTRHMASFGIQLYIYQCKHCRGWHLTRNEHPAYWAVNYFMKEET